MARGGSAKRLMDKLGAAAKTKYVFTGMIKPADDDENAILFARSGDCAHWASLSADHIEDIELVDIVYCGGHTHPLVRIYMKEPETAEGKTFAALATLHRAAAFSQPTTPMMAHVASISGQPGSTPCHWDWTLNRWVCP